MPIFSPICPLFPFPPKFFKRKRGYYLQPYLKIITSYWQSISPLLYSIFNIFSLTIQNLPAYTKANDFQRIFHMKNNMKNRCCPKQESLSCDQYKLSDHAKDYLTNFYRILDQLIEGMDNAPLNSSISHNFISQMIPHHEAAIEMSKNLLRYTSCIPLRNIAEQIIAEQTKSIENMQKAECNCNKLLNSCQNVDLYQRKVWQIMNTMFTEMGNAPNENQINSDFIREMIPHHMGAIHMSKNALKYDICPELCPILLSIIKSQEQGVRQMQQLLCQIKRQSCK